MISTQEKSDSRQFVVIGAGPAGLTAAYELLKRDCRPVVLEKAGIVGGLSRTESYQGNYFDMGGHRFFTKSKEVQRLWEEILTHDFLKRPRLSRIYYRNRFFNYPLKPLNALVGLGPVETVRITLSYLRWTLFPHRKVESFEQWVTNRFGKRLFEIFFKSYTEKVWGIPCSELRAEWAAQRIKNLSLKTAIWNMFFKPRQTVTTLIDAFNYPRLGPGMLWTKVQQIIEQEGGEVRLDSGVVGIQRSGQRIESVRVQSNGHVETIEGTDFISSMPVTEFIKNLSPPAPEPVREAAARLSYRDFLTVCLIVDQPALFPDNWIYIHDPSVQVGRIQNFKNWSPEMVADASQSSLGLEYFCNVGDALWTKPDAELIEQAKQELEVLGLARAQDVRDGCVFRMAKAYPVYDSEYADTLQVLKDYIDSFENFQTIGRNGLHRYNNQDHAMLTGMLAVRNAMEGGQHNLWVVNAEQEYHEEVREEITDEVIEDVMAGAFAKIDRTSLGISLGIVTAAALFLATIFLVLKGGSVVGPNLSLLSQYLPGYRVNVAGSLLGMCYGFLGGFVAGWVIAFLRNSFTFLWFAIVRSAAERQLLKNLLSHF